MVKADQTVKQKELKMTKYNKAYVPIVLGLLFFLNQKFGINIPLDETGITAIATVVTSLFVYLVPNRA